MSNIEMTLGLDEREVLTAFLTVTCISRSYEVETINDIVTLFDDHYHNVRIYDMLDHVSTILITGRIMDLKLEIKESEDVNRLVMEMRAELEKVVEDPKIDANSLVAAYLAANIVANTAKMESYKEIIKLWQECRKVVHINYPADLLALVLTTGRILELKVEVSTVKEAQLIHEQLIKGLSKSDDAPENALGALAAALLTAAFIEITPKMERITDIIATYQWLYNEIDVNDRNSFLSAVLASARIRDLDARHMLLRQSISDIINKINVARQNLFDVEDA